MSYLWDTSAILAHYLQGDDRLAAFAEDATTTANNLLEAYYYGLAGKISKERMMLADRFRGSLVPLSADTARQAAELRRTHRERGWSYIDAMTYAAARENGMVLVAVGKEFEGLPGVVAFPP